MLTEQNKSIAPENLRAPEKRGLTRLEGTMVTLFRSLSKGRTKHRGHKKKGLKRGPKKRRTFKTINRRSE